MVKQQVLIIDNDPNDPTVLLADDCKILIDYEMSEDGKIINIKKSINIKELTNEKTISRRRS
jgi:hypothetical protein